jgi:hypothetical protein
VNLCDTSEHSSLPDSRRRFSRPLRHRQTPAGVIAASPGTGATGAVAIMVAARASSVASLSVRWPSRRCRSPYSGLPRVHDRRRLPRRAMAPRPTDTVLLRRRPVAMTSSMVRRRCNRAITSNMGHRLAMMTSSMALRRGSRAITSNMGHRPAMIGSTARPRDTMTGTEQSA